MAKSTGAKLKAFSKSKGELVSTPSGQIMKYPTKLPSKSAEAKAMTERAERYEQRAKDLADSDPGGAAAEAEMASDFFNEAMDLHQQAAETAKGKLKALHEKEAQRTGDKVDEMDAMVSKGSSERGGGGDEYKRDENGRFA